MRSRRFPFRIAAWPVCLAVGHLLVMGCSEKAVVPVPALEPAPGKPDGAASPTARRLFKTLDADDAHFGWMARHPCGALFEPEIVMFHDDIEASGGYVPVSEDGVALLDYMSDDDKPIIRRLVVAGFLLRLNSAEAHRFVETYLFSRNAVASCNALWVLNSHVLRDAEDKWAVGLLGRCIDELPAHARQVKAEHARARIEEAIARDGGVLVMVDGDGIEIPLEFGINTGADSGDWHMPREEISRSCWALAHARGSAAVPRLMSFLDKYPGRGAADALAKLKPVGEVRELCRLVRQFPAGGAAKVLGCLDDRSAIPALLETLKKDDGEMRKEQAVALGKLRAAEAVPHLAEELSRVGHGSALSGKILIAALRSIGGQSSADAVARFLEDGVESPVLRASARVALADMVSEDFGAALIDMLSEEDHKYAKTDIIAELRALREKRAVAPLLELARRSPHGVVRAHSIWTLRDIGGLEAVTGLVGLLDVDFSSASSWRKQPAEVSCRRDLLEALEEATGQSFGNDNDAWRNWSKSMGIRD